jgi:hypothetical protein
MTSWRSASRRWSANTLVGIRHREAERAPLRLEELEVEAGLVADLACRVANVRADQPLDGQQCQPVLGDRLAELLELDAVAVQLVEQRAAPSRASPSTPSSSPCSSQSMPVRKVHSAPCPSADPYTAWSSR